MNGVVKREEEEIVLALELVGSNVVGLVGDKVKVVVVVGDGVLERGAMGVGEATGREGEGELDNGVVEVEEAAKRGEEGSTKH